MVRVRASMRPAQKAPENLPLERVVVLHRNRFNEAGAKSAGKTRRFQFTTLNGLALQ